MEALSLCQKNPGRERQTPFFIATLTEGRGRKWERKGGRNRVCHRIFRQVEFAVVCSDAASDAQKTESVL